MTTWQSIVTALRNGTWTTTVGALLSLAVTLGVLTATQETAIQATATALATLITVAFALVHTFSKAKGLRIAARAAAPHQ